MTTKLAETLFELLSRIAKFPMRYAATPEEAHGMIEAIAWVVVHEATGAPMQKCIQEVLSLVRESMPNVYPSESIVHCLADTSFPNRDPTFDNLTLRCETFLKALNDRFMSGHDDNESEPDKELDR